jgi:regulator of sigma E protease
MNYWYFLAAIPVFGLLVLVHEFGHFITAKWAGIRVEEFGLGFPPAVIGFRKRDRGGWEVLWFGRQRDGELVGPQSPFAGTSGGPSTSTAEEPKPHHTIYSLNLLPIGGFVRMPGENGDLLDKDGKYDEGSFSAKPAGKRIIVLVAGVVMNVLLAMVLFTIAYGLGEPTYPAQLDQVLTNSPAAASGLKTGDTIVSINGQSVADYDDMHTKISADIASATAKDKTLQNVSLQVTYRPQGSTTIQTTTVNARTPANPGSKEGAFGVTGKILYVKSPLWHAPFKGIAHTFDVTSQFFVAISQMIRGIIQPSFVGPVGIVQITGNVAQAVPTVGWFPILSLVSILSLNLAIVNILPFPALDGGRIVLILIELVRGGKRLKPEREGIINLIGFALLLTLMVVVTVSDVTHWGK